MTIENIIESDLQRRVEVMILFFTASALIHERRCKDERCGSFLLSYSILWFLSVKPWQQRSVLVSGNPADGELLPGPRTHWCHCVCSLVEKGAAQARCPNYRWEDEKKPKTTSSFFAIHLMLIFHSALNTLLFKMSVSSQTSEFLSLNYFLTL